MKIHTPHNFQKIFYLVTSANRVQIGTKHTEFLQEKLIELQIIDRIPDRLAVQYKLHNQVFKGTSLMHRFAADMESLYSGIIFITNKENCLLTIYNFREIVEKWKKEFIPLINDQYPPEFGEVIVPQTNLLLKAPEKFISTFSGYSSWRFFFQNWYRTYSERETATLTLNDYFGSISLPLALKKSIAPFTYNTRLVENIKCRAALNNDQFDRASFARMLKDLTQVYNIDATLNVDMEENYTFLQNGTLNEAELFLETRVADWYAVTTAHQLKQLQKEEVAPEDERMKQENKEAMFVNP
ncbi:MAG: hypothetical protein QM640_10585 [Niabella sp.]